MAYCYNAASWYCIIIVLVCHLKAVHGFVEHITTAARPVASLSFSSPRIENKSLDRILQLHGTPDDSDDDSKSIITRFTSPRIDDIGLPLADSLVAQFIAPSFQVFTISLTRSPLPTWLSKPLQDSSTLFFERGYLLAPTLIHGVSLACCWLLGALAAQAYESEAFDVGTDYSKGFGTPVARTLRAGAFATGLLILGTQVDLFLEFGGRLVQLGESEATDIRLVTALNELFRDIIFEASFLFAWRMYRANLTADPTNRQR